ncbi:MAG: hypothetical protein ABEL76_06035 [Bradymonadaceae bacterium]
MSIFWSSSVQNFALLIHILASVFWLGWMVFMFGVLRPVLVRLVPDRAPDILGDLQQRVRRIVFWLIPIILATGLYNMAYRSLLEPSTLVDSELGHRMLAKLAAASVIFGIYYLAPHAIRWARTDGDSSQCHGDPDPLVQRVSIVLHVLAFGAGLTAAFIGVSLF